MNISLFTRIAPVAVILLIGCNSIQSRQSARLMKPLSDTTLSQQQTEQQRVADEQARLDSCRKALESLKEVNPKQADKLGNEFTALLSAATQYNSVRSKVAEPTKQGIDSMYQFKSIKLCADIEKALIDSLVKRGENVQL
ncbi:permease [Klebsiella pasteurii]|uniref:permease n=1 Tax=Klebsiella pasteurii TaxID=2587529 RepID=UPI00237BB782|nr:permease [Klebsiella pasteurii]MDD9664511.1 permease [Klebsiella pasteurii]MDD9669902.1 permease [Klebsiella pasteurii]MDD9686080.1 permease [Klebsiella pasteurii]